MGVLSYIGDVTTPDTRTRRMIILESLTFLSSLIAYFGSGVILERFGFMYVYVISISLYVSVMVYILFVEESYIPLTKSNVRNVFGGEKFKKVAHFFAQYGDRNRQIMFLLLVSCLFCLCFSGTGIDNVLVLYLLHSPLTFTASTIGLVLSSESIAKFICMQWSSLRCPWKSSSSATPPS